MNSSSRHSYLCLPVRKLAPNTQPLTIDHTIAKRNDTLRAAERHHTSMCDHDAEWHQSGRGTFLHTGLANSYYASFATGDAEWKQSGRGTFVSFATEVRLDTIGEFGRSRR